MLSRDGYDVMCQLGLLLDMLLELPDLADMICRSGEDAARGLVIFV